MLVSSLWVVVISEVGVSSCLEAVDCSSMLCCGPNIAEIVITLLKMELEMALLLNLQHWRTFTISFSLD